MSKVFRNVVTIVVTMVIAFSMMESASAEEYPWCVVKNPGNEAAIAQDIKMDVYTGNITYKVTGMSGNCSYQVCVASSAYPNQYYINNSEKCVKVSKVNGEMDFTVKFINFDITTETYMYIRCTMEHNASIGETAMTSGILYH